MNYYTSLQMHWLDNIPKPEGFPVWPDLIPEPTIEQIKKASEIGMVVVGDPDDCAKAVQRWVDIGADQICFSPTTNNMGQDADHRVDGAVRQRGHPAVRHRPGAPHHPHARGRGRPRPRR